MSILDLWLPILVSTVVCFFVSFLIWAVLKWHNRDYKALSDEEAARAALRGTEPGYYLIPYCTDPAQAQTPEMKPKFIEGPVGYLTIAKSGAPGMGPQLVQQVIYFLAIAVVCAYMVSRTTALGADYLEVFRIAGTVAFIANGFAVIPESIWFSRPWSMAAKNLLDALIYALLIGGIFGWLV